MTNLDELLKGDTTDSEEQESNIPKQYVDYLERTEKDYIKAIGTLDYIKNILVTFSANSINITIVLMGLDFGLGLLASSCMGFMIGSIPGCMEIAKINSYATPEEQTSGVKQLAIGGLKLLGSGLTTFVAGSEYGTAQNHAIESIKSFQDDVKSYEQKPQPTILDGHIIMTAILSASLVAVIYKIFKGKED